ncbi:hypothetical protein FRB96_006904 [Tulasnella sp. 330]|nr:hypothetical protein FRB96_006904 [Tulasnella sp. 330]
MASRHPQSARPVASRLGAFAEGTLPKPEHVDIGGLAGASASEILASLSNKSVDPSTSSAAPPTQPSKKDKQKFRHEALITRLATQPKKSPYSRPIAKGSDPDTITKTKAMKRKVKSAKSMRNALATPMTDLTSALEESMKVQPELGATMEETQEEKRRGKQPVPSSKTGGTLTAAQKRRILLDEQRRQPLLRDDTAFSANPFEAIRLQAMASQSST